MIEQLREINQIDNKNLSEEFKDALNELRLAAQQYKDKTQNLKEKIDDVIKIGRKYNISDQLISQYVRDILYSFELSDRTVNRYLPEELKRNYNKSENIANEILPNAANGDNNHIEDNSVGVLTPELVQEYPTIDTDLKIPDQDQQIEHGACLVPDPLTKADEDKDKEKQELRKEIEKLKQDIKDNTEKLKQSIKTASASSDYGIIILDLRRISTMERAQFISNVRSTNVFRFRVKNGYVTRIE